MKKKLSLKIFFSFLSALKILFEILLLDNHNLSRIFHSMKTVHEKSFEIIFFVPVHPTISVDDDELKLPNCDRAAKSEFSTFFFLLRSAPFFGEN